MRANPQGGVVSAGSATISSNASTVRINQHTDRAVIDWRGFDIAPNERTEFQQPNTGSIALNRVNSGGASRIDGQLSANGNIVIVNQNGVVFGRGAQVDVNSLIATTSDIRNEQFMAGGKLVFDKPSSNPNAQIINEGTITAKDAGLVGFVAPRVENRGVIAARLGRVHLASGDTATVDFYGDGLLEVAVSDNVTKQLVSNTGVINADGGLVAMTAAAGKNIIDSVINGKGTISAKTIPLQHNNGPSSGKILIAGNNVSDVIIDGLIDASGLATGQTGGAIHIIGNRIALMNSTRVDVSGNAGAGEILVGGDYRGGAYRGMLDKPVTAVEWGNTAGGYSALNKSPTAAFFAAYYAGMSPNGNVPTASRVFIDKNVMMVASSDAGNAGRIITWSNNGTAFYGHADVSATGIRGNGGFIEISGKDWLGFNGTVNTHASHGANGMLLLDPTDVTISTAMDADITASSPFDSTGNGASNLNVTTLQNALASGAVTITSAAGSGGTGNITFVDAVAWNSSNALTVTASNNIIVNNTITNAGTGNITLNANIAAAGSITIAANVSTGGSITMLANRDMTLNATRTLTTGATGTMDLRAANGVVGGTGNLTINGNLSVGSGGLTLVSGINGTRPNYTANNTTLVQNAGSLGTVSISGFQDISIARAITSNGNITISPQRDITLTAAGSLTSTGASSLISILAQRDITLNASSGITTGASGSISLQAANGSTAGTGNLTLSGNLSIGTGTLTLLSGINGTRPNITLSSTTLTQQGASIGNISVTGFQDVTVSRAITASGTINLAPQRDFIIAATGSLTSTNTGYVVTVAAPRDITINASGSIVTTSTGGLNLQAAGGSTAGTGNLTLNGNLSVGTGALTLLSGVNGTRPSLTLSSTTLTPLGASIGATSITGFNDLTISRAMTVSGALTITTVRDLTLSGVVTAASTMAITSGRDLIINSGGSLTSTNAGYTLAITTPRDFTINAGGSVVSTATGGLNLQAAGGSTAGTGNFTLSGSISTGTGALTLLSGINGTRPNLTLSSSTFTQLGATIGTMTLSGFQDITLSTSIASSAAMTVASMRDTFISGNAVISSTGAMAINPTRDFITSGTASITAGANFSSLAQRDITIGAGTQVSSGSAGSMTLQAANNAVAGTGNLTISGKVVVGSGTFTLVSGVNGTRPSLTLNSTTYSQLGANVGVVSITGMQDVTVATNITSSGNVTISPQRDFIVSAGAVITTGGTFLSLAQRDITINATGGITTGATGSITLQAANNAIVGTGNLTINGNLSIGTGTLTLVSGINGTRPSLTLNSTTLTPLGATIGAISITGMLDVTVARNITGSGAITISPQQSFTLNNSATLTTTAASNITILALRDITVASGATISGGNTGSLILQAANNSVAGTGNLTLSGNVSMGTGVLTLTSGINGTRPSWTIDNTTYTQLTGSVGVVTINGFQDVTVSKNFTGSGNITINPQRDFILSSGNAITVGGAGVFTVLAQRDVITNATSTITTGATGGVSLRAANAVITGTGNLTLGGTINIGTGALTLLSGINGTRPSLTLDSSKLALLGATVGATSITGYQDVTVAMSFPGNSTITISPQRDFILNSGFTLSTNSASAITILALRDITTAATSVISAGTTGSIALQAANNVVTGTGNLNLSGNLAVGSGTLTLRSGINGTRPSFVIDNTTYTQNGATVGVVTIDGYQDVTVSKAITGSGNITINPQRDFVLSSGQTVTVGGAGVFTVLAQRDVITNATSTITTGATGGVSLRAANAVITGTGNLTLGGTINIGTGALTLLSGINGTRPSLTLDSSKLALLGATVGATSITGYQDVTVAMNIPGNAGITIQTQRDLTLNASQTIATGAAGALILTAANNVVGGTGNLTLSGNLSVGTGGLTLLSGINGTRPSYTMSSANFTQQGANLGVISIQGFQDLTIDRSLTASGNVTIISQRDLTLNATRQITSGAAGGITMGAANNTTGGTGNFYMNGILSVGTGALSLTSGINGTRPSLTLDSTNLIRQGATFGAITVQGFNNLVIARDLNSSSTVSIQNNTSTSMSGNISGNGAMTFSNAIVITEGQTLNVSTTNAAITFSSTINGTAGGAGENLVVSSGTGAVTFSGIVGGAAALNNLTVNADNVTVSANLNGTGTLTMAPVTAARAVNLNTAQTDAATGSGFNLSTAEVTRIVNGWGSLVFGSTGAGALTNSKAAWSDPVTFITGNDFASTVAMTSADTILINAGRDVLLTNTIATTNTTSNAIIISAGRNFTNTAGANPLSTGAGGRWLVYSTNPTDTTGEESMSNAFNRYTCTLGACPTFAGTGNGLMYSYTPMLDVTIDPQSYNYGDAIIPPTGYTLQTSGYLNALDSSQGIVGGVGNFQTSYVQGNNAGTGFTITNNGSTFSSNLGYGFNYVSPTGLTVGQRAIALQVSDQTRTYGNAPLGSAYTIASGSFYGTDAATLNLTTNATLSSSGNYNYRATPWALSANGATFTSGLASNYSITYFAAPTGLTITQRPLAISAAGVDRVYNGLTAATVNLGDNRVSGDILTTSYTTASFLDKNVAAGKAVNVSGINLTNTDAGNYTFNTTASTTAEITPRALTITATGIDKVYNGNAAAGVSFSDDRVAGDTFTTSYGSATFGDKNVGTGKAISVAGISLTTGDAGNYTFNATASASANITPRALTISATGVNKIYNGLAAAAVTFGDDRVAGDVFTINYTGNFDNKNVGVGKAISVTGINLAGTDSGNYSYATTASTAADITQRALTISAVGINKIYDGVTTATANLSDDRVAGDVFNTTYTGNFTNKNVGNGKAISITGINITTGDAANYAFNTTASTAADITQRSLTITATGIDKVYNGNAAAGVSFSDDRVAGDVFTTSYGSATFGDKNVGIGKAISIAGINIASGDAANYSFNTTANASADITQRSLTITATGIDKVYNGNAAAGVSFSDDRVAGDTFTTSYGAANFANKNVGTGKAISITGINIASGDAGNYTFNTTASASANISQRGLTISATGADKVYNGNTTAGVSFSDDRVAGDTFTTSYSAANFANKNVGVGKSISVTGLNITGGDAANYLFNTTASTSADITQRSLTITATGIDKVYNGNAAAGVSFSDDRVAGDVFTTSYGSATFGDKNVGIGKAISVTGINIASGDAANYSFNTTANASADITQRALTVSATGADKVYNGNTTASVSFSDDRVAGDTFTTSYGTANFANKNVGIGKAISVTGINIASGDAANYSFNTTANASADITQRTLTISATGIDKVYDGLTTATANLSDDRVAGDVFTTTYAGTFGDKNVGIGKAISIAGINIASGDAANYIFNTTASAAADITQRALTITATSAGKVYNGLTTAGVTLNDNRVAGDVFTTTYGSADFADKNVGVGKSISVSGISISTGDAGNYTFNTTASASANISQRGLTISATGADKVYNGNTTAGVSFSDDRVAGDVFTTSYGAANFANKNVGVGKSISVTGLNITGGDAANYLFNTTASASADITQRALTISATGVDKIYNGTLTAGVNFSDDRVAGDTFTTSYGSATFGDKNVGIGKAISVTGINITSGDAANYTFNTTASTAADITQRALTISATGVDKVYNGLTTAGASFSDDRVAGDVFTTSYGAANFANKNVGNNKSINVTGLSITGGDSANYSFNTTASASADITQRALTITATGIDKVYNGNTVAAATLSDDRVAGDVFTTTYTGTFANKNVGSGKTVNITGINITTGDAGNYTFNTSASATADITPRALTIGATGISRAYNGLTTAGVTLNDNRVAGDVFTTSYTSSDFADKNVGTGKSISVLGLNIAGGDSGNYTFNATASASANITKRALLITASGTGKVYDGLTAAGITLNDNRVAGDVFTTSYGAATFVNKNAGVNKTINVTGISIATGDAGNYAFNTTASTTATITPRTLVASIVGVNKVYDGTTTAGIHITDNRIAGDVFGYTFNSNFNDKNVGVGKAISVTGISLVGVASGNYVTASTGAATADITPRALLISATASNKVYDGNDNAIVTLSDNRVSGDILTYTYSDAHYSNSSVGTNKPVNVTGLILTGTDSSNYTYNSSAMTIADILATGTPVVVVVTPTPDLSLALQLPNTVKKSLQTPLAIPEFLIFDDEWQKRQRKPPTVGMLH